MPGGSALFLRNLAILASELHKGLPGLRCGNQSITHDPPWLDYSENIVRGQSLSHTSWHNCVEAVARSIKKPSDYCWCSMSTLTHNFQNIHLTANIAMGMIDARRTIWSTTCPDECVALVSKHRIWRPNKLALHGRIRASVIPKRRIWRAASRGCPLPTCMTRQHVHNTSCCI